MDRAFFDYPDTVGIIRVGFDDGGDHQVADFCPLDHGRRGVAAEHTAGDLVAFQCLGISLRLDFKPCIQLASSLGSASVWNYSAPADISPILGTVSIGHAGFYSFSNESVGILC